jgi:DNA processing protein
VPVYSGLALGIDGEAHAGAIEGGGTTVAVLGGGVERARPAAHRRLYRQILDGGGAVIGEWPPGTPARPFHFPRRNRLLAALSEVVVVVEAGERSGALSTAAHARRLGREVTAVPGPIDRPGHVGSNRLIRDGCAPILEVRDVLDRVGVVAGPSAAPTQKPQIEGDLAPIWRALEAGPSTLEVLAGRVAMPSPRLMEALTRLEIRGLIRRERGLLLRCAGE